MAPILYASVLPLVALSFLCGTYQSSAQGTIQFRFEEPPQLPGPGQSFFVQQYFEANMWFRPLGAVGPGNGFGRTGGGISTSPENGGAYLRAALGYSLVFSFSNDSVFSLISVDLAEYSSVVPVFSVLFVGYRHDGSIVTTNMVPDGIIDGTGPLPDFQTFYFGPEFTDLDRVEIPTFGWSLDNLVVSIPEPASGTLLIAGGLLLWSRRIRRSFN